MPLTTAEALPDLPPRAFEKADTDPDPLFYQWPRFVTHIDDGAIAAVTALYEEHIPSGARVLDLMGSWVSHLPEGHDYASVVGHGMNAEELAANLAYASWFTQDLNADPNLPLDSESVDAVLCCVSVQYLTDPVAVFAEVHRVLAPGGVVIITFSNRCFPTKAIAIWQAIRNGAHQDLVSLYLDRAGFDDVESITPVPPGKKRDPLWAVIGRKAA